MQSSESTFTTRLIGKRKGSGGFGLDVDPRDCVTWDGNINPRGYGRVWVETSDDVLVLMYAHRVAWEAWRSPIPDGMTIDHLCVNTACVNPDHLDLVTLDENIRRHNMRVTHCPKMHEYTEENTRRSRQGNRSCRRCHRERARGVVNCAICGREVQRGNLTRHRRVNHAPDKEGTE